MSHKKDIRSLALKEIEEFCLDNNLPKFRAKQVWEWLWKKRATSFEEITSLSKFMRELFKNKFTINTCLLYTSPSPRD